jgi:hypothetical protein
MKISAATYADLQRIASKLSERSSFASYLTILVGAFVGVQYQPLLAKIAAAGALIASGALFALSDPQVRALLTGQKP